MSTTLTKALAGRLAKLREQRGMTDEMRAKATELLKLQRAMFPPKALPARITSQDPDRHPVNGRFLPQSDDGAPKE